MFDGWQRAAARAVEMKISDKRGSIGVDIVWLLAGEPTEYSDYDMCAMRNSPTRPNPQRRRKWFRMSCTSSMQETTELYKRPSICSNVKMHNSRFEMRQRSCTIKGLPYGNISLSFFFWELARTTCSSKFVIKLHVRIRTNCIRFTATCNFQIKETERLAQRQCKYLLNAPFCSTSAAKIILPCSAGCCG